MSSAGLFNPRNERLLSTIDEKLPCRTQQVRALAASLSPKAAPCRNCIVHGTQATGKSAVVAAVLEALQNGSDLTDEVDDDDDAGANIRYAMVSSAECITGRHLLETTLAKVAQALQWETVPPRCETLSQLTVELSKMLKYPKRNDDWRFVLVFDAIDTQREAPPTLLPALARLSEIIPCLSTVFIMTHPPPNVLRTQHVTYVHFPNYAKTEFVQILSLTPPSEPTPNTTDEEASELWTRYCGAVHDALCKPAARNLTSLRRACNFLWHRFTAPIRAGTLGHKDFAKLLITARVHFQDDTLLDPGIIAIRPADSTQKQKQQQQNALLTTAYKESTVSTTTSLATLLPSTARVLLIAGYLASHNAVKHDLTIFSTHYHGRRRKTGGHNGGGAKGRGGDRNNKHRKIARRLLGAHAFVLERMMAIFAALCLEWGLVLDDADADDAYDYDANGNAIAVNGQRRGRGSGVVEDTTDIGMALATLSSLRLLVRAGASGDVLDRSGKWRINVGWEMVRSLGRSMGVEVEEWLIE